MYANHCIFRQGKGRIVLPLLIILALGAGCSMGTDKSEPLPERSPSELARLSQEGSGTKSLNDHPPVDYEQIPVREVRVPQEVQGKWKAVKILVRHKRDGELTGIRIADLGSSFSLRGSGLKVTVGAFLPNFVMDKTTYTSVGNEELNPAVQLQVEENGKIIYKGWAFKKFPSMYAFEHEVYSLELLASVPVDVS